MQLSKGTERMELEDHHLVRITFRELWDKGTSQKMIWIRAVHIARGEELDYGERFRVQIWKQQQAQICCNIEITSKRSG